MVHIEPVAAEEGNTNEKIPKTKPIKEQSSSSTAANVEDSRQGGGTVEYASDGFETASETELNDEEEAKQKYEGNNEKSNKSEGGDNLKVAEEASSKEKEEKQPHEQHLEPNEEKNDEVIGDKCIYSFFLLS